MLGLLWLLGLAVGLKPVARQNPACGHTSSHQRSKQSSAGLAQLVLERRFHRTKDQPKVASSTLAPGILHPWALDFKGFQPTRKRQGKGLQCCGTLVCLVPVPAPSPTPCCLQKSHNRYAAGNQHWRSCCNAGHADVAPQRSPLQQARWSSACNGWTLKWQHEVLAAAVPAAA